MRRILGTMLLCGAVLFALLVSFVACNYWFSFNPRSGSALRTKTDCNQIVDALWRYQKEQDSFPPSLESLVPRYLPSLPKVAYGDAKWFYHQSQGEFTVGFTASGGYPGCYYSSKIEGWYIDE